MSGFLGQRIEQNRESLLEGLGSPIPRGFEARAAGRELPPECHRLAADSDLYKWLEGAAYVYARTGDAEVRQAIDRIARLIVQCQHADGYVNTQVPPNRRFDTRVNHELYNAGHFFEAAVAHWRATGSRELLEAACRWADYLIAERRKGNAYFEVNREHSGYELGLLRLHRATGQQRYLDFALTLTGWSHLAPRIAELRVNGGLHAVRVGYYLAACADLYAHTGREDLWEPLPGLWRELVTTRMYVTGGLGMIERLPQEPFELPLCVDHPDRDVAETCGSVALILWSWRMHSVTGESQYFDVIERALYNNYLGSVSPDNLGTFYYNPLRVTGDQSRKTDHYHRPATARCRLPTINRTACCITNTWRLFGALPEYVFSTDGEGLLVNLYTSAVVDHTLADGRRIRLAVQTDYPHDGRVVLRFDGEKPTHFRLRLRIPGWCRDAEVEFAGKKTRIARGGEYFTLDETWILGDTARLVLPMPARMVLPDPRVKATAGQVAFARGPLVYCLESEDVPFPVQRAAVRLKPEDVQRLVRIQWRGDLPGGAHVLRVPGLVDDRPADLVLVPWYLRANRSDESRWVVFLPNSARTGEEAKD